jgi:hypothetical protein
MMACFMHFAHPQNRQQETIFADRKTDFCEHRINSYNALGLGVGGGEYIAC